MLTAAVPTALLVVLEKRATKEAIAKTNNAVAKQPQLDAVAASVEVRLMGVCMQQTARASHFVHR